LVFFYVINRILREAEGLTNIGSGFRTLKLEDLHLSTREVLNDFCNLAGIEFENCMLESTWHGKEWWGDAISGKYKGGFNPKIEQNKWEGHLSKIDNFLIETLLEPRLRHYNYPITTSTPFFVRYITFPLLNLLPMTYEVKILKFNLSERRSEYSGPLRIAYLSYIYYQRRVILFYKRYFNLVCGKTFLAPYLGKRAT